MKTDLLEGDQSNISKNIDLYFKVFIMVKNGRAVFISLLLFSPQIIMKVYMLKYILNSAALAFQPKYAHIETIWIQLRQIKIMKTIDCAEFHNFALYKIIPFLTTAS